MPTTDLSIGRDAVLDFACTGWPHEKREELARAAAALAGVRSVGNAGISTMRVGYDPNAVDPTALMVAICQRADTIMPGHGFAQR